MMKELIRTKGFDNRRGMVLVVALLIMALMSLIGSTAVTTSTIDIQISTNTKLNRQAFYFADGGLQMAPKFVRSIIEDGAVPVVPDVTLDAGLLNEVLGYAVEDPVNPTDPPTDAVWPTAANPDVQLTMGAQKVIVDIDRKSTETISGSGVEFASGAEGVGIGTSGGVMVFYSFEAIGTAANNAQSHLDVYYRFVLTAGGK